MRRLHSALFLGALTMAAAACGDFGSGGDPARREGLRGQAASESQLTAEQCAFFDASGTVQICHRTSSATKPYTILKTSSAGCISGHSTHAEDYVAVGDPTCNGQGCYPAGAPFDGTVECCGQLWPDAKGHCADLCAGVTCGACDVANSCDNKTGRCAPRAAGSVCRAAVNFCDAAEVCSGSGGACPADALKPNGTACDDGNANTVGDLCTAGTCAGIDHCLGVTCAAPDQCHVAGTCDHATGICSNPTRPVGTACVDGLATTIGDACNSAGACVGRSCAGSDCIGDGSSATSTAGGLVSLGGVSFNVPTHAPDLSVTSSTRAPPTSARNGATIVAASAVFEFGPSGTVFSPPLMVSVNVGAMQGAIVYWSHDGVDYDALTADGSTGLVTVAVDGFSYLVMGTSQCIGRAANTPCGTTTNVCATTPTCQLVVVTGPPSTSTMTCELPYKAAGAACDDSTVCNGHETCNGSGICGAGTPLSVPPATACTSYSCNAVSGIVATNKPASTACDDSTVCNGHETCNGSGSCGAGTPLAVPASSTCTSYSCNAVSGIVATNAAAGAACDDSTVCNGRETCNGSGSCGAGTPLAVPASSTCTSYSCDPVAGVLATNAVAGTACDDGNSASFNDRCDATGGCAGSSVPPGSLVQGGQPAPLVRVRRSDHRAVKLADGRVVLIAGGNNYGSGTMPHAVEIFDPAAAIGQQFSGARSTGVTREDFTATLLDNGSVLVVGGFANNYGGLSDVNELWGAPSAQIFNPSAPLESQWSTYVTPPPSRNGTAYTPSTGVLVSVSTNARFGHTATKLPDGRVVLIGGEYIGVPFGGGVYVHQNDQVAPTKSVVIFNTDGSWMVAADTAGDHVHHTATLLQNGKILVTGGTNASVELYDPGSNTWTTKASLPVSVQLHTATLLPNGNVLVLGGVLATDGTTPSLMRANAEVYDPSSDVWTSLAPMAVPRYTHEATLLPDGTVLVTGARDATGMLLTISVTDGLGNPVAATEVYDPRSGGQSIIVDPLPEPRYQHEATLLNDGTVLVSGGTYRVTGAGGDSATASVQRYTWNAALGSRWRSVEPVSGAPLKSNTATLLPDGKVLVTGGRYGGGWPVVGSQPFPLGGTASAEVNVYDPSAPAGSEWTARGSLPTQRQYHSATLLSTGKVLVVGGADSSNATALSSAQLYDPSAGGGSWTTADAIPGGGRWGHTATTMLNGKVLVVGGLGTAIWPPYGTVMLFDPAAAAGGQWTQGPSSAGRFGHTSSLLPGGKVLVVGGYNPSTAQPFGAVTVYDPGTNSWANATTMPVTRQGHTATVLSNGSVVVIGGATANGGVLNGTPVASVGLYNPSNGLWSALDPIPGAGRFAHTATLLPGGQILVTGGSSSVATDTPLSGVLLFNPAAAPGQQWTQLAALPTVRDSHTATLLLSGKTLLTGGYPW